MVEGRPDWVISRQRAWGVPIALFVERKTQQLLVDPEVNQRIVAAVTRAGRRRLVAKTMPRRSSAPAATPTIMRWSATFSTSGSTADRPMRSCSRAGAGPTSAGPPTSISKARDQHRGWFQSSLARKLRDARPGAVRRGPDPRLHDGRQGHENVQEPGQHGQPARPDARLWRGHPAAVGAVASTSPRTTGSGRRYWPGSPTSIASSATPSAICSARSTGSARRSGSTTSRNIPSSSATCSTSPPSSTRSCAARSMTSTSTATSAR